MGLVGGGDRRPHLSSGRVVDVSASGSSSRAGTVPALSLNPRALVMQPRARVVLELSRCITTALSAARVAGVRDTSPPRITTAHGAHSLRTPHILLSSFLTSFHGIVTPQRTSLRCAFAAVAVDAIPRKFAQGGSSQEQK